MTYVCTFALRRKNAFGERFLELLRFRWSTSGSGFSGQTSTKNWCRLSLWTTIPPWCTRVRCQEVVMVNTGPSHMMLIADAMRFFGRINVTLNSTNKCWQQQQFCWDGCIVCLFCVSNLLCFTSSKEKISETALMLLNVTLQPDVLSEALFSRSKTSQTISQNQWHLQPLKVPAYLTQIFWPTKFFPSVISHCHFYNYSWAKETNIVAPTGSAEAHWSLQQVQLEMSKPKKTTRCVYFTWFAPSSGDKSWAWDEWGELFNQVSAWQRAKPQCLRTFFLS